MRQLRVILMILVTTPNVTFEAQYFSTTPKYSEVNPGSSVVLSCVVSEKSSLSECVWQHDRLPVRMQEGKYEWAGRRGNGDCSLRILKANLAYDDGMWECQVSQSSYQTNDGLSSEPAQLVVRHPPAEPRIYTDGRTFASEKQLSVLADREQVLTCESRGGNPAPVLTWYLGDTKLEASQRNESAASPDIKQWTAVSSLVHTFSKLDNRKTVKCSVYHEALTNKVREARLSLDIQFPPSVTLERVGETGTEVEDGLDPFRLRCLADGNPKPDIVWRKLGQTSIFNLGEFLKFEPVKKSDSGTYICLARNSIGASDEISAELDVKYPPRNIITDPENVLDLSIGQEATLRCEGDGSPEPSYEWQQLVEGADPGMTRILRRANDTILHIRNVSYESEGMWRCTARNKIKGNERVTHSEPVRLEVSGRPLPLVASNQPVIHAALGKEAELAVTYCADPPPLRLTWEWANMSLAEGGFQGRFTSLKSEPDRRRDCYRSRLVIRGIQRSDEATYSLVIDNGSGILRSGVKLAVKDPVSMVTVLALSISVLVIIVICCICTAAMRRRHVCCFRRKEHFHQHDIRIERREDDRTESEAGTVDGFPQNPHIQQRRPGPVGPEAEQRSRQRLARDRDRISHGLGQEVTYQGHAGVGRPVPSPQQRPGHSHAPPQGRPPPPRKTPQNVDIRPVRSPGPEAEDQRDGAGLIAPRKVRGTPTMYADLQFPKSSNSGDMKRGEQRNMRARIEAERDSFLPRHKTEYGRVVFNPAFAERANL